MSTLPTDLLGYVSLLLTFFTMTCFTTCWYDSLVLDMIYQILTYFTTWTTDTLPDSDPNRLNIMTTRISRCPMSTRPLSISCLKVVGYWMSSSVYLVRDIGPGENKETERNSLTHVLVKEGWDCNGVDVTSWWVWEWPTTDLVRWDYKTYVCVVVTRCLQTMTPECRRNWNEWWMVPWKRWTVSERLHTVGVSPRSSSSAGDLGTATTMTTSSRLRNTIQKMEISWDDKYMDHDLFFEI